MMIHEEEVTSSRPPVSLNREVVSRASLQAGRRQSSMIPYTLSCSVRHEFS